MRRAVVLNTRPYAQADELSTLLRNSGFDVLEAPAVEVVPAWDAAELARVSDGLANGAYAWVVLQSINAAAGLPLQSVNVLCGAATAHALGLEPARSLERFSAAIALQVLQPLLRPGARVLVPHSAQGRDELIDGLRAAGVHVDAPIAYRTMAQPLQGLADQPIDVVTLCSPSAVRSILDSLGSTWLAQRRVVCLGETTAATARELGVQVSAVATQTSMPSLVDAVRSLIGVPA